MRVPQLVVGPRTGAMAVELEKLDREQRVAVRMPSQLAEYLRGNYSNLNLQGVPSEREALQLVVGGQASFAVLDEAQLSRLSRESEFGELAVVGDIGLPQLLRLGSRRDWPVLADVLEQGLQALPAKELEQLHQRWLQPKYPRLSESPGSGRTWRCCSACCCCAPWLPWCGNAGNSASWSAACWLRGKAWWSARCVKRPCA